MSISVLTFVIVSLPIVLELSDINISSNINTDMDIGIKISINTNIEASTDTNKCISIGTNIIYITGISTNFGAHVDISVI